MGIQSSLTETKQTAFKCDLIRNERAEVIAHIAYAIASGCWCGPEMWKGLFIFVKRHFNCIVKPQYVRVSCFQVHWDCIKGGGGIHGKEGRMPVAQATGVRAGPCLAHGHQPALISFVSEAMDDEPGLLVCLEIGRLNRWWIRGMENLWQTQKVPSFCSPATLACLYLPHFCLFQCHNFSKFSKKPPLPGSPSWPLPAPLSQDRNHYLY